MERGATPEAGAALPRATPRAAADPTVGDALFCAVCLGGDVGLLDAPVVEAARAELALTAGDVAAESRFAPGVEPGAKATAATAGAAKAGAPAGEPAAAANARASAGDFGCGGLDGGDRSAVWWTPLGGGGGVAIVLVGDAGAAVVPLPGG